MSPHMTPEEFRKHGHAVIDWIAGYWAGLAELPVTPGDPPGAVAARLPASPPACGEPFEAILADLGTVVAPGLAHWQHPGFFGYFPANTSGPSVLGDLVSSGLGVQGMLWATSPACTEIETVVLDWLAELLDLPARMRSGSPGGGVIQDSASSAALVATLAALHRASGGAWRARGIDRRFTAYTSTQGHSSIEKAARIAGVGADNLRLVGVDDATLAMRPGALAELLAADRAAGATPALVVATVGTTSTAAVDPLPAIGRLCREYGAWLHVDGAYAGAAAACPEFRGMHDGLELADSYCFDPHKWLLTGFDCDAFWVADRDGLTRALTILPEYLRNAASESGEVIDYRDWQVPLGRRFRALKLWFVLRWYGVEGLRAHIRRSVALAADFADRARADGRFEIVAPVTLSLVCFRLRPQAVPAGADVDAANAELLRRVNASAECFLTHTSVRGHYALRLAVGSPYTGPEHVAVAWRRVAEAATGLLA